VIHVNMRVEGAAPELERRLARAAAAALDATGSAAADLSLTLVDDDRIGGLNHQYLGRIGPTDVLAFALHHRGEDAVGDIYIGYQQALRQAAELGIAPEEELDRLAIHGTLHVLGYDHPEGEERLDCEMWRIQERVLEQLRSR
jgi:probable rRNA maturation factor